MKAFVNMLFVVCFFAAIIIPLGVAKYQICRHVLGGDVNFCSLALLTR